MADKEREDQQRVGHDSTTIPGGEKDLPSGDPGRTPSKAEGDRDTVEEDLRRKGRE
jgi:hypothetical protein